MRIKTLRTFQEKAIDSAVRLFDHHRGMLDAAGDDEQSRATAIHANGYLLIEAPTGAGKTLMAGNIVERVSAVDRIVWFWFAPFKGVVDQSAAFLREQFHGLRLRTLSEDRSAIGTRSGDVFVTTWQLVATRVKDRRSVRQDGELNDSVDTLVESLRQQGFRIGVVVDEAHHGFHGDTQAAAFFRGVLKPEYTVLVTATPDDADLRDLQERMQIGEIHKCSVSREDAVLAGLVKQGIKCVAWRAEEGTESLVDFEATALREATALHKLIKAELAKAGIDLVPLMLVQATDDASVGRIRERLVSLGFNDSSIATHTAKEPDAGLLALANDETREVLIFKMAVALGFDAPRAWTLVSMRAARDEDFGVQLVGRILRVHRRLQRRDVPEILKFGYVLLADPDSQTGIDAAGQRINRLRTTYATLSPTTIVVQVGDREQVQVIGADGQTSFIAAPPPGAIWTPPPEPTDGPESQQAAQNTLFNLSWAPDEIRAALRTALLHAPVAGRYQYPLRDGVPRQFHSQELPPDTDISEQDCADRFVVSAEQLLDALLSHERVRVQKRTLEIFTHELQMELGYAPPSLDQMRRTAQRVLLNCSEVFSPKELRKALMRRLHVMLSAKGVEDADDSERLSEYLDVLLAMRPVLLNDAHRAALADAAKIIQADEIPERIESETPLPASRFNAYGILPPGLNSWEVSFGEYLDADDSGTVLWWHRNPSRKPWSINVLLDDGRGFYPDFVVGIADRPTLDHGLLADTKYAYETSREMPKILAEHSSYGRVLILSKDGQRRWALARLDASGRAVLGARFDLAAAARY